MPAYRCMDDCASGPVDYLAMDKAMPGRNQYGLGKLESTAFGYSKGGQAELYAPIEGPTR